MAEAEFITLIGGFTDTPADHLQRGFEAARKEVALDERDAAAHAILGVFYLLRRQHALAIEELTRALAVNPSSANAHHWLGLVYAFDGRSDEAIDEQETATRLSPNDPRLWAFMNVRGYAYLHSRRFDWATEWADRALRQANALPNPHFIQIIALSHMDRSEDARRAKDVLLNKSPDLSIEKIIEKMPINRQADIELWSEGLRRAGVPEK